MGKTEWHFLIGAAVTVDLMQAMLDFFGIGLVINRFIDIVVGMALPFYLSIRGVKMTGRRVGSIIGAFILEEIPGIDALPLWTADVLYIYATVRAEEKGEEVKKATLDKIKSIKKPNFDHKREDNTLNLRESEVE